MWHWNHNEFAAQLFARQVTLALERGGIAVFRNVGTTWHYDDDTGAEVPIRCGEGAVGAVRSVDARRIGGPIAGRAALGVELDLRVSVAGAVAVNVAVPLLAPSTARMQLFAPLPASQE